MSANKTLDVWNSTDWQELFEPLNLEQKGNEACPPGFYIQFKTIYGQEIMLHIYCTDGDQGQFSVLEKETLGNELTRLSRRPQAQERYRENVNANEIEAEIKSFFSSLPDKGLRPSKQNGITAVHSYRQFRRGLAMATLIVLLCALNCCAIMLHIFIQHPSIQPEWVTNSLERYDWIEDTYKLIRDRFK